MPSTHLMRGSRGLVEIRHSSEHEHCSESTMIGGATASVGYPQSVSSIVSVARRYSTLVPICCNIPITPSRYLEYTTVNIRYTEGGVSIVADITVDVAHLSHQSTEMKRSFDDFGLVFITVLLPHALAPCGILGFLRKLLILRQIAHRDLLVATRSRTFFATASDVQVLPDGGGRIRMPAQLPADWEGRGLGDVEYMRQNYGHTK